VAAVLQNQRDAQGDDELTEVALIQRARRPQAGYPGDQEFVQERAADEHQRRGADRADERSPVGAEEGQRLAAGDQIEAGEHAQHEELALGEVHDPHDAEDESEADAHEAVDATDRDARGDRVQHVLDQDFQIHRACAFLPSSDPGEVTPLAGVLRYFRPRRTARWQGSLPNATTRL